MYTYICVHIYIYMRRPLTQARKVEVVGSVYTYAHTNIYIYIDLYLLLICSIQF